LSRFSSGRIWFAFGLVAVAAMALPAGAFAAQHHKAKPAKVKVMTRNVYLGADLSPAINAVSGTAFIDANGQIVRDVDTNDFPTRATGLAQEILAKQPDLVGLQEVALWRSGPLDDAAPFTCDANGTVDDDPPFDCNFTASTVRYDYLKLLLAELNDGADHYRLVKSQREFDFEAPADYNGTPGDGDIPTVNDNGEENDRLTMRDAILAKVGSRVKVSNVVQAGHYHTMYEALVGGLVTVHVVRGWTSADVKVGTSPKFRFVNTHFEAFGDPHIRAAQAKELVERYNVADPKGRLPIVLVGDLNSDNDTVSPTNGDRLAYKALTNAGYVERSTANPLGCCLNADIITDSGGGNVSDFDHQVDHIMTDRPKRIKLVNSSVTGLNPVSGFWDSDHAGLFSTLSIAP
jgi:endonuclease/exonuclease/phosphatase family metal-dependent hydrolase